jgi:two-component system, cell cycle response regulator DivK
MEKTILVAEDDENNFALIDTVLKKNNYRVLHAKNGLEAVEICRREEIDLVLMDIKMPVMDGYTATKQILEIKPGQKIISQTAYAGDRKTALENGCIDFISKPFTRSALLALISNYI